MNRPLHTQNRWRFPALLAILMGALVAPGCVTPREESVDPGQTFEWLYARDLSTFERQLAMERHHGLDDAWTRVGEAWLDLVNCSGLDAEDARTDALSAVPAGAPMAELMYATVVLEMRRRNARVFSADSQATTIFSTLDASDFFDRDPKPLPDHLIRWPGEQEAWIDEGLGTVSIESHCPKLRENLLEVRAEQQDEDQPDQDQPDQDQPDQENKQKSNTDHAPPSAEDERRRWLEGQLVAVERAVAIEGQLPQELSRDNIRLLLWRVRTHGAHLAATLASGTPDDTGDRPQELRERGFGLVEPLDPNIQGLDAGEAAPMLFLRAKLAADLGQDTAALADLERALDLGLGTPNAHRARYLAVRLLTDMGRWDEALSTGAPLPRKGSPIFEPMAYRLALASRQVGDDERFFRIAMETLADTSGPASPFNRAIYAQALDLLATYEFDKRVVELVENLGPRNQVFDRLAELARVSLKRGYFDNAAASAGWLLRHHHNSRYAPKYHRLLALAAFVGDNEAIFREHVHAMTRRSPTVVEAVGAERQADFFADADREFARLMGQMLPAMAEWGEDPGANSRRQKWLTIIVEETQIFLRGVERSQVRPELLDLYRVASNLLEKHPRGYAERLGTKEPTPLVLGTVEVGHAELVDSEPAIDPVLRAPYVLTLVPRAARPPGQWPFGWPDDVTSTAGGDEEAAHD